MTTTPASDSDYAADTRGLVKPMQGLHRRAHGLSRFNMVASALPMAAVAIPVVFFPNTFINPGFLLGAAALTAATTQVSRWIKSGICKDFKKLWDSANPQTRSLLLGHTHEMMGKINPRSDIISRQDFSLRNPHSAMTLAGTCAIATVHMPLAPLTFFGGAQLREIGESARLEIATRHNLAYLHHFQPR